MKRIIAFFEIPAIDFKRAVEFYQIVFNTELWVVDGETEKMAFFREGDNYVGAISFASDFHPCENGVLISFNCDNMDETFQLIQRNGGKVIQGKTKIESEEKGFFSLFLDSEGNRIGLYSAK